MPSDPKFGFLASKTLPVTLSVTLPVTVNNSFNKKLTYV
jgi:hypothetical protein